MEIVIGHKPKMERVISILEKPRIAMDVPKKLEKELEMLVTPLSVKKIEISVCLNSVKQRLIY